MNRKLKIILFVIALPIYIYFLTISEKVTGQVLGITIIGVLFYGFYLSIKFREEKSREVLKLEPRPKEDTTTGTRERRTSPGKATDGNSGKSEGQLKVPTPSSIKDGKNISSNREQHPEDRKTTESDSPAIPPVEPVE